MNFKHNRYEVQGPCDRRTTCTAPEASVDVFRRLLVKATRQFHLAGLIQGKCAAAAILVVFRRKNSHKYYNNTDLSIVNE